MLHFLLLLPIFLAFTSTSVFSLHVPRAVAGFPNPLVDPFYSQPSDIASKSLGQILDSRETKSTFTSLNLERSYQIKFRSEDSQSRPIATVTTVLVPRKKTLSSSGVPNILSFQNFEDAVSLSCSPSWAYVANSGSAAALFANLEAPIINNWALDAGYYVVIPDHGGPTSSFIAGKNAGKIVLDSLRAAITSEKLSKDSQIAMYGYSGGANAAIFASSLAQGYAPELKIVGVTSGGTPVSPEDTFYFINGGLFGGLSSAGALGLASQYPDTLDYFNSIVTAEGNRTANRLRGDGICVAQVALGFIGSNPFSWVSPRQNFLLNEKVKPALAAETLIQAKASYTVPTPQHPILMYHGFFDEIVPFNSSQLYITEQCAKGANIRRYVFGVGGHITTEILGIPGALAFIQQAFTGTLVSVKCGTTIPEVKLGSAECKKVLGTERDAALQKARNSGSWHKAAGFK